MKEILATDVSNGVAGSEVAASQLLASTKTTYAIKAQMSFIELYRYSRRVMEAEKQVVMSDDLKCFKMPELGSCT